MLKKQNRRIGVVALLIFSMLLIYGSVPTANAANLTSAKAVLADSGLDSTGTTTITFEPGVTLTAGTVITVNFNAGFDLSGATTTCPGDSVADDDDGSNIYCTVVSDITTGGTHDIEIVDVNNPDAENPAGYDITISHDQPSNNESTQMRVYIIDAVTVTATVNATLEFSIDAVLNATDVNGVQTTGDSAADALDFGTLTAGASSTLAQQISVTTNATAGYTVTVQQDQDMTSAGSATINAFADGTVAGPNDWAAPSATLGDPDTYGHMGLTSEDADFVLDADTFGFKQYVGLDGTDPVAVLYNDGPANGTEADTSRTEVAYTIEISTLQEAGDYTNTLTYVCTPTY